MLIKQTPIPLCQAYDVSTLPAVTALSLTEFCYEQDTQLHTTDVPILHVSFTIAANVLAPWQRGGIAVIGWL